MEEIAKGSGSSEGDLVQVAFAASRGEAEAVRGLLDSRGIPSFPQPFGVDGVGLRYGVVEPASHRVMVRAADAEGARQVLRETEVEAEPDESELANALNLDGASRRGPRNYSLPGGYARALVFSAGSMAVVFALFLLIHAL